MKEAAYGPLDMKPWELGRLTPAVFFEYHEIRAAHLRAVSGDPGAGAAATGSGDAYEDLRRAGFEIY